jgi:hypothetical protein
VFRYLGYFRKKKALFFKKLEHLGFECDKKEYFTEEKNYQYNLLNGSKIDAIKAEYSTYNEKDIETNLNVLTKINILRQGKNVSIEDATYFFLTATSVCLNIANRNHIIHEKGAVPLASTIGYFTEKMWIKTNKNFANINIKSINVVTNAQLVLKSMLDISIDEKYKKIEKEYKEKKRSIDEANAVVAEIHSFRKANLDVSEDNIDEILNFTSTSIESFIDNYYYEIAKSKENRDENEKLRTESREREEKLKFFEEREAKKKIAKDKFQYVSKTVGIFVVSIVVISFSYFLNSNRDNNFIAIILGTLGITGTLLGVLRFFGIDFKFLKEKLLKVTLINSSLD